MNIVYEIGRATEKHPGGTYLAFGWLGNELSLYCGNWRYIEIRVLPNKVIINHATNGRRVVFRIGDEQQLATFLDAYKTLLDVLARNAYGLSHILSRYYRR